MKKEVQAPDANRWSIGIYEGSSPLALRPAKGIANPVLTANDVTDVRARFVADPFLFKNDAGWWLFFEILNDETQPNGQGDIGYASSPDGLHFTYGSVVLNEPFHLSYPYVFEWRGDVYMVPEANESKTLRLYRATDFPRGWELVRILHSGADVPDQKPYVDPSLFFHDGLWWVFWSANAQKDLHLYHSLGDDLLSTAFVPHPKSPVVRGDANFARPGGRVTAHEGSWIRYNQDDDPSYGNQVHAFRIKTLTTTVYEEEFVGVVAKSHGCGWGRTGMHNVDPVLRSDGTFLAAVDAIGQADWGETAQRSGFELVGVSSEERARGNGAATNAFDDSCDTIWHTSWSQGSPAVPPHHIDIDLGAPHEIFGFRVHARRNGTNGRPGDYAFFVGDASSTTLVASGRFSGRGKTEEVRFAPRVGSRVRLEITSEFCDGPWAAVAEIDVIGLVFDGNRAPNGVIVSPEHDRTIVAGDFVDFRGDASDADSTGPFSFHFKFGNGSRISDRLLQNPGPIRFPRTGTYRTELTVRDAFGRVDLTPDTRQIRVLRQLPRTGWRVVYVDSEETVRENGRADNAIDGRYSTYWHTNWSGDVTPPPHEIQIDMGSIKSVEGVRTIARQSGTYNGAVKAFEVFTSTTTENDGAIAWRTEPDATGDFAATKKPQDAFFPRGAVRARYLRFRALSEANGGPWTSLAEIFALGP